MGITIRLLHGSPGVRFLGRETYFCLLHKVQTGFEAQSVSYASDEQTTARGPDAARLEVLSGPRQILK